jgi:hypothetical protein
MRGFLANSIKRIGPRRLGISAVGASVGALLGAIALVAIPVTFGATADTSTNPSNTFSGSTLYITSSSLNGYIVSYSNGVPGDVATGTVTITNAGALPAAMTLSISDIAHKTCAQNGLTCTGGAGTGDLSNKVTVRVRDLTTSSDVIAAGTLWSNTATGNPYALSGWSNATHTTTAKWASSEAHTFQVTVTFPKGSGDNAFQGTSATLSAVFTGTQ